MGINVKNNNNDWIEYCFNNLIDNHSFVAYCG